MFSGIQDALHFRSAFLLWARPVYSTRRAIETAQISGLSVGIGSSEGEATVTVMGRRFFNVPHLLMGLISFQGLKFEDSGSGAAGPDLLLVRKR